MRRLLIDYNASKAVLLTILSECHARKPADANVMHIFYLSTRIYADLDHTNYFIGSACNLFIGSADHLFIVSACDLFKGQHVIC